MECHIFRIFSYNGMLVEWLCEVYDYGARFYMPDIGRWGTHDPLSELQFAYSPYSYVYGNPIRFNDPTGMIGEDPDPKKVYGPKGGKLIEEVVIKGYKKIQSAFSNIDFKKVAEIITPIRPVTPNEQALLDARYGKADGLVGSLNLMWRQMKDVPGDLSDTWENLKSVGESEDKEEIVVSTAILLLNIRKGKFGNIAKMGNLGGKYMKLAKLLKLNINSPTTMSILENADNTVQEFISTHRKGSIKSVFPEEHLNSTVKEAMQSGNTTVRKLLTDKRFLK